jgi:hypothetical protein
MDEVHVKLYLHIAEASYILAMSELNKDILPNWAASLHSPLKLGITPSNNQIKKFK